MLRGSVCFYVGVGTMIGTTTVAYEPKYKLEHTQTIRTSVLWTNSFLAQDSSCGSIIPPIVLGNQKHFVDNFFWYRNFWRAGYSLSDRYFALCHNTSAFICFH